MIRHLSRSHEVTVASMVRSDTEADQAQGIAPYCHRFEAARVHSSTQTLRMLLRVPTFVPSSMGFFYSRPLAGTIDQLLHDGAFDLVFVHCSSVAQYVADVTGVCKILDFGDMDSCKWLDYARFKPLPVNLAFWLEGVKLRREERRLTTKFDLCTTTTRAELETLRSYGCVVDTDWFPNGVDSDYFAPGEDGYDPDVISFVGRMDYYPNQEAMFDFCANVLPLLRQRKPNLKLQIVGADPSRAIRRLAHLWGVEVTGSVPDVRPYVRGSAAMVAPLNIARGTQNKLLESMAMGVPVVTSPLAAGGVDAVPGEHLCVAHTPDEYCDAIVRLCHDPVERTRLSLAGRQRMLSHHNWENSMRKLDRILERCVAARGQTSSRVHEPQEKLA
jgi:sugar transferase (PEP-CTERM/EpsH1 system associated)